MVSTTKQDLLQGMAKYNTPERKIEFLENELKKIQNPELKKECHVLTAQLYDSKRWWSNAAKNYRIAADLATLFPEKMSLFFKTSETNVKAEDYFTAEDSFRRALALATQRERKDLENKFFNLFLTIAKDHEDNKRINKAISVYNKLLSLPGYPFSEAQKIRDKLIILLEKIGRPFEANQMRNQKANYDAMSEQARADAARKAEETRTAHRAEGFYELDF